MRLKYLFLLLTVFALIFLCGCVNVDINLALNTDNSVDIEYNATVDSKQIPKQDITYALKTMDKICQYYSALGYEVDSKLDSDIWELNIKKHEQFSGAEYAAESFDAVLKSRNSIFTTAKFEYKISDYESAYYFEGTVNPANILDDDEIANLPGDIINRTNFSGMLGEITLSLPASEIIKSEPSAYILNNSAVIKGEIYADSPLTLGIATVLNERAPDIKSESLKDMHTSVFEDILNAEYIIAGCAILLILFAVLFLIIKIINKKKR